MTIAIVDTSFNCGALVDQLLMQWDSQPYAELSVTIAWLRALSQIHQSHHWQASADPFYGDHLMFERLYNSVGDQIDSAAEKAVGMGTVDLVEPMKLIRQTELILAAVYFMRPGIPQPTDLASRSLNAEKCFLQALNRISDSLESRNLLTKGVDNMLADFADKHESNCYLLKQRCGSR